MQTRISGISQKYPFLFKADMKHDFCPVIEKNFYYQKPKYKTWELKTHVWRLKLVNCLSKELYQAIWPNQEVFSFSKLKIVLKKVNLLSIWQMTNAHMSLFLTERSQRSSYELRKQNRLQGWKVNQSCQILPIQTNQI